MKGRDKNEQYNQKYEGDYNIALTNRRTNMLQSLSFEQLLKGNELQYQELIAMWIPYMREIFKDDMDTQNESDADLEKYAYQRVNIQGQRKDMHFELVYLEKEVIGFALYAVDLGGIKGLIEPGYGYIMEYYIIPSKRRKGYGMELYQHLVEVFKSHKVKYLYLTPDNTLGIHFWSQMGFLDSGKIDPDNKMPIYIKAIV